MIGLIGMSTCSFGQSTGAETQTLHLVILPRGSYGCGYTLNDAGQISASKFGASSPRWWQSGDEGELSAAAASFSSSIFGNDSVLYHSFTCTASPQQVSGSLARWRRFAHVNFLPPVAFLH